MRTDRSMCLLSCVFSVLFLASAPPTLAKNDHLNPRKKGVSSTNSAPKALQSAAPMPMMMPSAFPLFIEDRNFTSSVVMINGTSIQTFADITLRDLHGSLITTQRVHFAPHSQQVVQIAPLLVAANSRATAGSITVQQDPARKSMQLAQLTMTYTGSRNPNYIDEEIFMPSANGSQILRAVADSSDHSPLVAITSLAEVTQNVKIECLSATAGAKLRKSVQLLPGETLLTEACTDRTIHGGDVDAAIGDTVAHLSSQPVGIALTSDAMAGGFAAFGLVPHESAGTTASSAASPSTTRKQSPPPTKFSPAFRWIPPLFSRKADLCPKFPSRISPPSRLTPS